MASPKNVAEPHKELRFTRAGQAQGFYITGAVFITLTVFILITWLMGHPSFRCWMLAPPAAISFGFIHLALHCTRHAYLILTPLGVEVFPLWKPEKNLLLIYWTEIESAEIEDSRLKLHRNQQKTSGVVISIKPILKCHRALLAKAIRGRMTED